jgi:anti-sigma regulatory factor (Ser/Thr protein kinase)
MGQLRALVDVPASARGPAAARGVVAALLPVWNRGELVDDVELVVSELVTNAFRHAPGSDTFELELTTTDSGVRVSLADGSAIRPVIHELSPDSPTGRGMSLVRALAADWGAESHSGGKRVWVLLGDGVTEAQS